MKTIDLSAASAAAPKKKPVFKSTLQPQNAAAVPAAPTPTTATMEELPTEDEDPSGMVRNGWAEEAYDPLKWMKMECRNAECKGRQVGASPV